MKKWLFFIIVIATTGVLWLGWRYFKPPTSVSVDHHRYPIRGIDVSEHTGKIDWARVKEQEVSFVFAKATEGEDFVNPAFERYQKGIREAGLPMGAYHFFRFTKDGAKQANHFLSTYTYQKGDLPPVLDVETWGNFLQKKPHPDSLRKSVQAFLDVVEKRTGQKVLLYANGHTYNQYLAGHFPDYSVWLCAFVKNPTLPDGKSWVFWQHAHNEKLDGVEGFIDWNVFHGDAMAWKRYKERLAKK